MTAQTTGADNLKAGGDKQPEMSNTKKRVNGVLAYVLLPGIIPELKELTKMKFGYLAFLIAAIYQMVRILPRNHPYTRPENIGKFGIRQVIATAANHIEVSKKNIDQVVVFTAILTGLILMVFQILSFLFFLFIGDAWAGPGVPAESASLFTTNNMQDDIAFYMIREVFGLPTMFGNLEQQTGLHLALHKLFEFYNLTILFVAALIFLYYVIVVVAETAQTGVPFGQRFSHIYAPFRLVIAIGLLVPLNYGFNGAQYMAFYAAKLGSSLATNGWIRFNTALAGENPLGVEKAALVAQPNTPDMTGLVEAMSVAVACREAYRTQENIQNIIAYFVNPITNLPSAIGEDSYRDIIAAKKQKNEKGHLTVYFGQPNTGNKQHDGNSTPYCGQIAIPFQMTDQNLLNLIDQSSPEQLQEYYFRIVWYLWADPELDDLGKRFAYVHHPKEAPCSIVGLPGNCDADTRPPQEFKKSVIYRANILADVFVNNVFTAVRQNVEYEIDDEVLNTGWGGAGIWYNRIAQVNGSFVTAVINIPSREKYPIVMEQTLEGKQNSDGAFNDCKTFEANNADNLSKSQKNKENDDYYAKVLNSTYQYWRCDRSGKASNFVWDSISAVFGLNGLFNIREEVTEVGVDGETIMTTIHPLAKLSSIGKSLVESAVANMGMAMGMSFGGGMAGVLSSQLGAGLQAASDMFVSIATVGLSVGFILYYILPFLPFMYFFFAVGGWVKGIFEAMVGTPLWALAHLRIDGEGLPGRSAMNGYILIFEIFLRPILTVFGLIGGLAIFTAMATILNEIFDIAVNNVTGSDLEGTSPIDGTLNAEFGRELIDEFFFTVVYAIVVYLMAMASFKMINLVPNNILRWLGQSVSSFNDNASDPAAGLTQYAAVGGAQIGGQLATGATQLASGAGSLTGQGVKGLGSVFGLGSRGSN